MKKRWLSGILFCVSACGASPSAEAPDPDFYLEPGTSAEPEIQPTQFCARLQQLRAHAFCTQTVDAEAVERMGGYALSYQAGRLSKACPTGWHSQRIFPDDRSCVLYDYAEGQLVRSRGVTSGGRTLWENRVSSGGTRVEYFSGKTREAREEDVFGVRLELDQQRRIIREVFLDQDGKPTPDHLGRYQLRYKYDARGEISELQVLDAHGTPTVDDRGVGIERYQRFPSGALREELLFDAEGKPVNADGLYQREVLKRDADDHLLEENRFRADGSAGKYEAGYSTRRTTLRGRRFDRLYLNGEGAPVRTVFGGSRLVSLYDEQNRPLRMEVFHLGRYVEKPGAFSILEIAYKGKQVERRFYGKDRKLMQGRVAFQVFSYTDDDFHRSTRYLDAKRRPSLWVDRASVEYAYTDGKRTEERVYGVDGKLLEKGIPIQKYAYDELGRVKERQGFDRSGNELPLLAARRISFKFASERNDDLDAAKAAAMERARKVWRRITEEQMSFTRAFRTYDELRTDEAEPELHVVLQEPDSLGAHLEMGGVSEPVEWDGAIRIYQRLP
ncbi:MAG: hypothetical protein KC492_19430 [Myxococcales bacterium]|nr:hypothetical protein [Myxococcales bacterium]